MARDWVRLAERQLARTPNAVDVRCAGALSRGPLDVVSDDVADGSSARIRTRGHVLTIPATHLPEAQEGAVVTCTDDHLVETRHRVHQRYPTEDGLTHVLVLAPVQE